MATWLLEDSDPGDPRHGLLEQFQTLADELRGEQGQPRDIAARPRKAGDEPVRNRIGNTGDDNGDGSGRLLGGQGMGCAWGEDDINLERNQFGRESGEPLDLPLGTSVFEHEVAALDVPEVTQSLTEGHFRAVGSGHGGTQIADPPDPPRRLRLGSERHGEETAGDQRHERAARHLGQASGVHVNPPHGLAATLLPQPGVQKREEWQGAGEMFPPRKRSTI